MVKVYHDDGDGVTEVSLDYFKTLKGKLGVIDSISIDADRLFTMEIRSHTKKFEYHEKDYEVIITLLSGVSCGYRGTGPRGSQRIIEMLTGVLPDAYVETNPKLSLSEYEQTAWAYKNDEINLLEHVLIEKEFEKGIIKW